VGVYAPREPLDISHRGRLVVYLQLLGIAAPSVDGPTADTGDTVIYKF
jgi:hypothetical protein